ncbi:hypothetical protein B5C34_11475 [Pacificimonas flava]|uniref:Methyl-accepting chemotaxis protein n=2 Tax=Pacificimonas TaxID=1960290 RepID=A0A219B897_9SPHN|nr:MULTISPECIES: methyl-accepting chemotaxis protein [Pacificimonas]MBZ6378712.1 HAMP domain-containing protein [Pacificimonas aurantium]OWV34019.1 hypothetical protein B5C34_11475 [Pacificimonas flava]
MAAGRFSSIRTRVKRASSQLFAVMDAHTRDWSVSRKLGGMIGLFAGFLVVSSLILIFCIVRTGHALQEVRTITAVSSSLSDANAAAAHAQSRAKDYVITPNAELGNAVVEEMEAAQGIVRNVDAQLGAGALKQDVAAMSELLAQERQSFESISQGQTQISAEVTPILDRVGVQIGNRLTRFVERSFAAEDYPASLAATRALDFYSKARIDVNRYRITGEEEAVLSARRNLLDLEDSLNRLFEAADGTGLVSEADSVIEDVVRYDAAFARLLEISRQRDADVSELIEVLGPEFESTAARANDRATALLNAATQNALINMRWTLAALIVLALLSVIAALLGHAGARMLVGEPFLRLADTMMHLASGRKDIRLETSDRKDELGQMVRAVAVFQENALEVEKQREAARLSEIRERENEDRRRRERQAEKEQAEADKRRAIEELADAFENSVHSVTAAISSAASQIELGSQQVAKAAKENAVMTADVAATAQQSSQNAMAVANASEEMARSIAEVSTQVIESSGRSQSAAERARRTDQIVQGLAGDANTIGDVVDLINSIAEQTNLLALNATIEAARAGDAGRGFSVVAGEIKALASQTSKATLQIAERVSGIQSVSGEAAEAIEAIGRAVGDIDSIAATVASAVEQQSATTSEIAMNTQQAAAASEAVALNISKVRDGIEETGIVAEQALSAAGELTAQAVELQRQANAFLSRVRAA